MVRAGAWSREVIGLIPAAGVGERLSPIPCSKEIYPIGFRDSPIAFEKRPKVACHYLLEKMRLAGIGRAYVILRKGKWDIPSYLGDGKIVDMNLAYLMMDAPYGAPYTLDQAFPFVKDALVAFGFPDILFQSDNGFGKLLSHQNASDTDLVLGLFPADEPEKVDMVDVQENCRVREIVIQPYNTQLRYSWDVAVWTPVFTEFLHSFVATQVSSAMSQPELSVGAVIQAAIGAGLCIEGVPVSGEPYLDIGTPEGLAKAMARFAADV